MLAAKSDPNELYPLLLEFNSNCHIFSQTSTKYDQQITVLSLLKKSAHIKAVTVCFSNIEGKLHMLDYDKTFLIDSSDNLTFDGSSVRGYTNQNESDLRLEIDWSSLVMPPWDIFGRGKVMVFASVTDKDNNPYPTDMRHRLKLFLQELQKSENRIVNVAAEIEGFLFEGTECERTGGPFVCSSKGGYYDTLPNDSLRQYIDKLADVQRAMAFNNEKDHPEVAPSQFELNWRYTDALSACDRIQLYKLTARRVAHSMGMTASFLPKPIVGINGNGMHTNISISCGETNIFHGQEEYGLSKIALQFIYGILKHAKEICLILNPSVNAYRRLDPHYEAPNNIFASAVDRGAMIRIPLGNSKSARIEVRSVSPDANPYMLIYAMLLSGLDDCVKGNTEPSLLPSDIHSSIDIAKESLFLSNILGKDTKEKYIYWKEQSSYRCPRHLGKTIKPCEILYHHEVTNQQIWNDF